MSHFIPDFGAIIDRYKSIVKGQVLVVELPSIIISSNIPFTLVPAERHTFKKVRTDWSINAVPCDLYCYNDKDNRLIINFTSDSDSAITKRKQYIGHDNQLIPTLQIDICPLASIIINRLSSGMTDDDVNTLMLDYLLKGRKIWVSHPLFTIANKLGCTGEYTCSP